MTTDIIIPTANNISGKNYSLYFTIRSILNQTIQPNKILVVENVDFEATRHKISLDFGALVEVIDGSSNPMNISYARNYGASLSKGDVIVFMDDDVIIGKDSLLERVTDRMRQLDFYCGATRYWTLPDWTNYLSRNYSIAHIRHILRSKTYLPKSIERFTGLPNFHEYSFIGHFGAIRRNVFETINGFDEQFIGWSYQDTDLMMRLCVEGFQYDLMYCDDIFVYHLAHGVDKTKYTEQNYSLYNEKQKKLNTQFHLNHFFGIFDDDSYSILSQ